MIRSPVIVVTSACGGCGVTTIALHLARCYRGCFVESARDAGAAERLGLDRAALKTWAPGSDDAAATLRLAALPMPGGFRALFAPGVGWDTSAPGSALVLGRAVVVDVPAGAPVPEACDSLGVVMPPTSPGAARTRALLEGIAARPHAVVVNRQGPGGEATRAQLQVALGSAIALELPCCPALRDAEDDGALLARRARWARRVERLAVGLAGAAQASPERTG